MTLNFDNYTKVPQHKAIINICAPNGYINYSELDHFTRKCIQEYIAKGGKIAWCRPEECKNPEIEEFPKRTVVLFKPEDLIDTPEDTFHEIINVLTNNSCL